MMDKVQKPSDSELHEIFFLYFLLKSWVTQNFITIKTSWNTNDSFVSNLIYYSVIKTKIHPLNHLVF
jgi:hypothetical protein